MATLSDRHKQFIVRRLAVWTRPSEICANVKQEFGLDVDRQQVQYYDPTKAAGADRLAQEWKDLFWETREEFRTRTEGIAIANKAYRLRQMQKDLEECDRMGNIPLKLELLEQAAKEVGDKYTNRTEITGKDGGPLEISSARYTLLEAIEGEMDAAAAGEEAGDRGEPDR